MHANAHHLQSSAKCPLAHHVMTYFLNGYDCGYGHCYGHEPGVGLRCKPDTNAATPTLGCVLPPGTEALLGRSS